MKITDQIQFASNKLLQTTHKSQWIKDHLFKKISGRPFQFFLRKEEVKKKEKKTCGQAFLAEKIISSVYLI